MRFVMQIYKKIWNFIFPRMKFFYIFADINDKIMTVVSSKEFITNEDKYFDLAMNEQIYVKRNNVTFIVTRAAEKKKNRLKPDDDLRNAITDKELLERVYVSLDKFFVDK